MKRLIDELRNTNVLNELQFEQAHHHKKKENITFFDALLDLQFVEEERLMGLLSKFSCAPIVDLHEYEIDGAVLEMIPTALIKRHGAIPLSITENGSLRIAMTNPYNLMVLDELRTFVPQSIEVVLASRSQIRKKIDQCFNEQELNSALDGILEFASNKMEFDDDQLNEQSAILNAQKSPIVNLVNTLIFTAIQEKASDIHIEPKALFVELRYRIDGVLQVKRQVPKNIQRHLVSQLKIMSDLDISECRRPQDGKIHIEVMGKPVDLRLSFMNTIFGEKVVLRILDSTELKADLGNMGFEANQINLINKMIKQPQGMIIVCGPTGAGKTSTLYALLNRIKSAEKNIMTIEDPVEYMIDGIVQTQVNDRIGITFASGMRTALRQDPDCILVGEIRDAETAEMAFRASLTGHLVLTTLHTNCSISSVTRLRNIGIDPFLIASSILGVLAQRLVRTNCRHCLVEYEPAVFFLDMFRSFIKQFPHVRFLKGAGCPECRHTGFQGRTAIYEILPFNSEIRRLVNGNASEDDIRESAIKYGFRPLIEEGFDRVAQGTTTLEELASIVGNRNEIVSIGHRDISLPVSELAREEKLKEIVRKNLDVQEFFPSKTIPR